MATVTYGSFTIERLSAVTWKLVQNDGFGQYPFIYAIVGTDKVVVIDTGVGSGGLRQALDGFVNPDNLPYIVICTHVHFDHIGNNFEFTDSPILMSSRDPRTTKNYELFSLCCAHGPGAFVRPFEVTKWLDDGEVLWLDDAAGARCQATAAAASAAAASASAAPANADKVAANAPAGATDVAADIAAAAGADGTSVGGTSGGGTSGGGGSVEDGTAALADIAAASVEAGGGFAASRGAGSTAAEGAAGDEVASSLSPMSKTGGDSSSIVEGIRTRAADAVQPEADSADAAGGGSANDLRFKLTVLHTPGHTIDSISVYFHAEKRLFVGDLVYPYTAISLSALGSAPADYTASIQKLATFVSQVSSEQIAPQQQNSTTTRGGGGDPPASLSAHAPQVVNGSFNGREDQEVVEVLPLASSSPSSLPSPPAPSSSSLQPVAPVPVSSFGTACEVFAMTLGMDPSDVASKLDVDLLVSDSCGGSVEAAIDLFLSDEALARQLAPPLVTAPTTHAPFTSSGQHMAQSSFQSPPPPPPLTQDGTPTAVVLSCGHVEAALDALSTLAAVASLCDGIKSSAVQCSAVVEDGVGEFSDGTFTIVAPLDVKWC